MGESWFTPASKLAGPTAAASCTQSTVASCEGAGNGPRGRSPSRCEETVVAKQGGAPQGAAESVRRCP
jgi:hypothetical protein